MFIDTESPYTASAGETLVIHGQIFGGNRPYICRWEDMAGNQYYGEDLRLDLTTVGTFFYRADAIDSAGVHGKGLAEVNVIGQPLPLRVDLGGPYLGTLNQNRTVSLVRVFPKVSGGTAPYSFSWSVKDGVPSKNGTDCGVVFAFNKSGVHTCKMHIQDGAGESREFLVDIIIGQEDNR